ncbi:hypothetical protein [Roseiconus nitratireducens]|nr:hypothetical protein [Roseiconus nitratireducens]
MNTNPKKTSAPDPGVSEFVRTFRFADFGRDDLSVLGVATG